jgi:hypothetical protein
MNKIRTYINNQCSCQNLEKKILNYDMSIKVGQYWPEPIPINIKCKFAFDKFVCNCKKQLAIAVYDWKDCAKQRPFNGTDLAFPQRIIFEEKI